MKERALALAIPFLFILTLTAQAIDARMERVNLDISFDGTTAICSASCKADSSKDKIEATITLYQGNSYVDSWSNSGTGLVFVSGSCDVKSGKTYKLVVDYSINGTTKEQKSTTGTCP